MEALDRFRFNFRQLYVITSSVMAFDKWLESQMKKQGFLNTRKGQEHRVSLRALAAAVEKSLGFSFSQPTLNKVLSGMKELTAVEARHMAKVLGVPTDDLIDRYRPYLKEKKAELKEAEEKKKAENEKAEKEKKLKGR